MRDLIDELNRTHRSTGVTTARNGSFHVVELRRKLEAPVAEVWNACTSPERLRRWFLPVHGDLRPGGNFQLEGNAGGTITICEPPHRLELVWQFGEVEPSFVALDLTSEGAEATELLLRHTVPDDDQWARYGPGAVGVGWDAPLVALSLLLDGESPHADQFTPVFMKASAISWGEAHLASTANIAAARTAAERTSDFYAPAQLPDA